MKIIGVIPARYASSRFPGKPLAEICGKPMIQRVYEQCIKVSELDDVYVATDDELIYKTVEAFGGKAIMTLKTHSCGTERVAECAKNLNLGKKDIVVNIQGDEPLIDPREISQVIHALLDNACIDVGTLKKQITSKKEQDDINVVKVVTDCKNRALYFSRNKIPSNVKDGEQPPVYKHIGIYSYRAEFLTEYINLEKSDLERGESVELLRAVEYGYKVRIEETSYESIAVDIPEHILEVERVLQNTI